MRDAFYLSREIKYYLYNVQVHIEVTWMLEKSLSWES